MCLFAFLTCPTGRDFAKGYLKDILEVTNKFETHIKTIIQNNTNRIVLLVSKICASFHTLFQLCIRE